MPLEQRAPNDGRQRRRHEQLRKVAQARRLEFAALDAAIDETRQGVDPARDHRLEIEGGELRMLVPFGDQEPRDEGALGADQLLDEGEEGALQKVLDRELGRLHPLADHVEMGGDDAADHRLEQLDLGLEIEIGQALAHLRPGGDVLEPRSGKALGRELLEGRRHDLLRTGVLASLRRSAPAGFVFRCTDFASAMALPCLDR